MSKENIILFDMDGTLTPARMPIEEDIVGALNNLSNYAKIGIVTGSGMDYLLQQCSRLWSRDFDNSVDPNNIMLMPCNGTQVYSWDKNLWKSTFSLDMKSEIGAVGYSEIIYSILGSQIFFMKLYPSMPVSGNFVSYRGSMINWCPIGRDCSRKDRATFSDEDINNRIRKFLKQTFASRLSRDLLSSLKITMGGDTSFDIYPVGWDKSFALSHVKDKVSWFVGDRCFDDGNDRAIYEALLPEKRAFSVDSTKKTIKVIDEIIGKIK